jgi:hypothetical protein
MVASIMYVSASCSRASSSKRCFHVPRFCQRAKRVYTDCQGPKRSGKSRHGAPVRTIQSIALTIVRWLFEGGPMAPRSGGSRPEMRSHCSSLSS